MPGLAGFAGEFPLLLGVFYRGWGDAASPHWLQLRLIAVLSLGGVVLGAWYMLWMYQRVFFGRKEGPGVRGQGSGEEVGSGQSAGGSVQDLSLREMLCLTPLVVMIFWIGLQPQFFLDRMGPTVDDLMTPAMRAAVPTAVDAHGIVGRWRSPPSGWLNGEWGPSQFVLELKPSGKIEVTWTVSEDSPGGGGVVSDEGTYRMVDDILTTNVIARGQPVRFEFRGDHLILTLPTEGESPSEVYEFVRDGMHKATEASSPQRTPNGK